MSSNGKMQELRNMNPDSPYSNSEAGTGANDSFEKPTIVQKAEYLMENIKFVACWSAIGYCLLDILVELLCGYLTLYCVVDSLAFLGLALILLLLFKMKKKFNKCFFSALNVMVFLAGFFLKLYSFLGDQGDHNDSTLIIFFVIFFLRAFILLFYIIVVSRN